MGKRLIGILIMAITSSAFANDSYEIISFKYKQGVSFEQQQQSIESLNAIVEKFDGFKSRVFYYSEDNKRWFDFITWESIEDAKAASEQVMANPQALEVFDLMDEESMIFSYYNKMGGVTKD